MGSVDVEFLSKTKLSEKSYAEECDALMGNVTNVQDAKFHLILKVDDPSSLETEFPDFDEFINGDISTNEPIYLFYGTVIDYCGLITKADDAKVDLYEYLHSLLTTYQPQTS
ncbi:hypothetical protein IWW37_001497 [Coemansia sp. RSA 2050]|nr:hypothetical protein IWW37_001497 [Coemansia sp. RSA 2050]KAJ2729866.1 hypothetical protein IW152_005472 [Coemansia sp. BCRC 34962]